MVNYLSAFCFGDFYTRKGLDLKTRELLTFAIVSTLGGCEAQVKAHVQGNANMGNSKQNLIDALSQMLPYIVTMIVLIFTSKNSQAPKAEGIPYDKGSR